MATLHLLSHSPFGDDRLASCLRVLGAADAVLLCGEAVQALRPGSQPWQLLSDKATRLYALAEDLDARAVTAPEGVQALDYPAFVELTLAFDKVNSWL